MTEPFGIPFIDISSLQAPSRTDWNKIADAGITTAYIRACEGVTPDAAYIEHHDNARAVGVKVGAYQFWRPRHGAQELISVFLDVIGDEWDLPPCIDLEAEAPADLLTPSDLEHHVATGLTEIRLRTGVDPILYTGPGFVAGHLPGDHRLGQWPLWCAAYVKSLILPRGWVNALAWQYTGSGKVSGYPGPADQSAWLCGQAALDALMVTP